MDEGTKFIIDRRATLKQLSVGATLGMTALSGCADSAPGSPDGAPASTPTEDRSPTTTSTEHRTPPIDPVSVEIAPGVFYDRESAFVVAYRESATTELPIETLELHLSGTNADGSYPLSQFAAGDDTFSPGDVYEVTADSLGLSTSLEASNGTFSLYYQHESGPMLVGESRMEPRQTDSTQQRDPYIIEPNIVEGAPDGVRIGQAEFGSDSDPVANFELVVENTNGDGTYPLTAITDDDSFDPGDSYLATHTTLGLAEPLQFGGGTFTLFLTDESGRAQITESEFPAMG